MACWKPVVLKNKSYQALGSGGEEQIWGKGLWVCASLFWVSGGGMWLQSPLGRPSSFKCDTEMARRFCPYEKTWGF